MRDAQVRCYSQEVREALRRSQELERPRDSPRGIRSALGLGEQPRGEVQALPWGGGCSRGGQSIKSSRLSI